MDKQNLVLRTCNKDGSSWDGFEWNLEIGGITTAPDWISNSECGNGLHGFLNGEGDGHLANWKTDAIWMVVEPIGEIVDLRDKVKFESATTHFVGNRIDATSYLIESIGHEYAVIGGVASTGDCGTATAGYRGTATAGVEGTATAGKYGTATAGCDGLATANDHGTAIAGMYGTATAGEHGTAIAGSYGIATAGCYGTATANDHGTAIAGAYGIATAGEHGRAIAGRYGTATVGCYGTATTGKYGTATAGRYGKATADCGSVITLNYWDGNRYRLAVGYIGEDGLLPNIAYKLDENHQFVVAL